MHTEHDSRSEHRSGADQTGADERQRAHRDSLGRVQQRRPDGRQEALEGLDQENVRRAGRLQRRLGPRGVLILFPI